MPAASCGACVKYEEEIRAWHTGRIEKLRAPDGWLTLAGLFWLKEGDSSVGSDPSGDIVLPGKAPKHIGTITVKGEEVRLKVAQGVEAACGGKLVEEMVMRSDADPSVEPDRVVVGTFTFLIIKRGGRLAVRLYDEEAETLLNFKGIETFPIDKKWRVAGSFEPYEKLSTAPRKFGPTPYCGRACGPPRGFRPRALPQRSSATFWSGAAGAHAIRLRMHALATRLVPNLRGAVLMTVPVSTVIHTIDEATVPGVVIFEFKGKKYRLTPMQEPGDEGLFFVFADKTNGVETYGGGRFLDAPLSKDGKVVLDFNKAYNPPCSFTPYATCPVPWPENRLPLRVEAGELKYVH